MFNVHESRLYGGYRIVKNRDFFSCTVKYGGEMRLRKTYPVLQWCLCQIKKAEDKILKPKKQAHIKHYYTQVASFCLFIGKHAALITSFPVWDLLWFSTWKIHH